MNCKYCDKEFKPRSSQQLYCTARCRQDKHNFSNANRYLKKDEIRKWVKHHTWHAHNPITNVTFKDAPACVLLSELLDFINKGE